MTPQPKSQLAHLSFPQIVDLAKSNEEKLKKHFQNRVDQIYSQQIKSASSPPQTSQEYIELAIALLCVVAQSDVDLSDPLTNTAKDLYKLLWVTYLEDLIALKEVEIGLPSKQVEQTDSTRLVQSN